jgi:hypothetical protein
MDQEARQHAHDTSPENRTPSWHPELLDGSAAGVPADCDLAEIWRWLHARLEWIGGMTPEQAHLTALLHWREKYIMTAIQAARLEAHRFADVDGGRKAYLEYLAADHLTQLALGLDPLPDLEPHAA